MPPGSDETWILDLVLGTAIDATGDCALAKARVSTMYYVGKQEGDNARCAEKCWATAVFTATNLD